ncbi:LPS export ABC transporter permease LptG [Thermodesulfobacteriota bacterium]
MTVLTRYILKEFLKLFCLCLTAFVALYLLIDFFERMDKFFKHRTALSLVFMYFLYKTPMIIVQMTPVATLISSLLSLGLLSRHNEIVVMKAGGINLNRVVGPVLAVSVGVVLFTWVLGEYVAPYTNRKADTISKVQIQGRIPRHLKRRDNMWYRGREGIYNIQVFEPETAAMSGVTVLQFDADFKLKRRIDATRARWSGDGWIFSDGVIREFSDEGKIGVDRFTERRIPLPERPDSFREILRDTEEMSFSELYRHVRRVRGEGYDATRYLVDLHSKLSLPMLNLITVLVGIGFALRSDREGGMIKSIVQSVGVGFVYYLLFSSCLALGHASAMPAFLAAWAPNILFAAFGAVMVATIKR